MSERLRFKRVRKGFWRNGIYHAERKGSKWNVLKKGRVVCAGVKDLTAASTCIIEHRKGKR